MACVGATIVALCALNSGQAYAAQPRPDDAGVPSSWSAFQASTDPRDKELVSRVTKMDWGKACIALGKETRSRRSPRYQGALREYLIATKSINGIDLGNIPDRDVAIGMTLCGVAAALGPHRSANQTQTANRLHVQLVYSVRPMYVYLDGSGFSDLLVTAIQR